MTSRLCKWSASLLLSLMLPLTVWAFDDEEQPAHWQKASERVVTVAAPYIDMHTFAGRGYPVFHVVELGDQILIHKSRNDWFKAETLDGKIGWIARNDLANTYDSEGYALGPSDDGWQDHTQYPYQLGLYAGVIEGAVGYTAFAAYNFTPNLLADIRFTQAFGNFSNLKIASLGMSHFPFPSWRISPFFRIGSGVIQTDPSTIIVQSEDRDDPIVSVGGGWVYHLSSRFLVRLEYDKHIILTTRNVNEEIEEWKAGFGVQF